MAWVTISSTAFAGVDPAATALPPARTCVLLCAGAAADVHWLNSLDGGNACLLVDCYRDLSDGVALEEALVLIEVGPVPNCGGLAAQFATPIWRAGGVEVCRGIRNKRSAVPRSSSIESAVCKSPGTYRNTRHCCVRCGWSCTAYRACVPPTIPVEERRGTCR